MVLFIFRARSWIPLIFLRSNLTIGYSQWVTLFTEEWRILVGVEDFLFLRAWVRDLVCTIILSYWYHVESINWRQYKLLRAYSYNWAVIGITRSRYFPITAQLYKYALNKFILTPIYRFSKISLAQNDRMDQVSHSRTGGASPRELFPGRGVDGALDFRAGYGDYAQCTVANTDNTIAARTEDCVVVLPTGNRTGTVKMLFVTTGRIVSRDQFKMVPMPDSAIARLNEGGSLQYRLRATGSGSTGYGYRLQATVTGCSTYRLQQGCRIGIHSVPASCLWLWVIF